MNSYQPRYRPPAPAPQPRGPYWWDFAIWIGLAVALVGLLMWGAYWR